MRYTDVARFAWRSLASDLTRTLLMTLAVSIGVGAVVVLTALGEGARRYVQNQFSQLGTNLIAIIPGKVQTGGISVGGALGGRTDRDLTLDDALALLRIPGVQRVAPLNVGTSTVSFASRSREVPVLGSTAELIYVRHLKLAQGSFLPVEEPRRPTPLCVIGSKVSAELFGVRSPLGEFVHVGDRRLRVIGVLSQEGESLGLDIDEVVVIPVLTAQAMFHVPALLRVLVETRTREDLQPVRRAVVDLVRERHHGEEDITVITEDAVLSSFDRIFTALTLALGGIASISLSVAGILIMNVMLIAVSQRRSEIGLLKAIGASPPQIRAFFFTEATLLSALGALFGSALGYAGSFAIRQAYPRLPAFPPSWAVVAAVIMAVASGILFSLMPARNAARLEPALALARR